VLAAGCHFTGPLALRPCLSAGLPLSVLVTEIFFLLFFSIQHFRQFVNQSGENFCKKLRW
jgi:hypothetical protein